MDVGRTPLADVSDHGRVRRASPLSIVIPVLNEASIIEQTLSPLQVLRERQSVEILLVDGGSRDATIELSRLLVDQVICTANGRGAQMNKGAKAANGNYLLFLHADTRLPCRFFPLLLDVFDKGALWGRFDVRLSGRGWLFRLIEAMMNWRSRRTGIATGDQAIFVRRELFQRVGGYPAIALMEDIVLSRKLKRWAMPVCIREKALTSSRRWEDNGIVRTVVLMWWLRARFYFGADPDRLAQCYR